MNRNKYSLTDGPILIGFILFAIPLFLGSLFQQLYGTVDLIFVGRYLGKTDAAAVGASNIIVTCLIGLFTGISVGASVITAQYFGAKDKENVKKSIENALFFAMAGGLLLTLIGQLLARHALIWLNTPDTIMAEALIYIRIYLLAILSMILYNMCAGIHRALGDTKTPFYVLAAGGFLNVFLDYIFIAVLGKGVAGSAIATFISQSFTALILFINLLYKEELLKSRWKIEPEMILRIIKVGVPLGIQAMILTLSNIFVQYCINGYGEDAVAAFTIYFKVENILYLPILAFGQTMVTFTGQNYGAGNYERIRRGAIINNLFSAIVIALIEIPVLMGGRYILGFFCEDEAVIKAGLSLITVSFPFYFIYSFMEVSGSIVRGVGKTVQSMFIVCINLCLIRVILLYVMSSTFNELRAVAAVYPMTWVLAMISFVLCYLFAVRSKLK